MTTSLETLEDRSGTGFPNLKKARIRSEQKLASRRKVLEELGHSEDSSVVFVGSIGRSEAVDGSDDDFMLLVNQTPGESQADFPDIESVKRVLRQLSDFKEPSLGGAFAKPVIQGHLVDNIGLTADDNSNTTRRMLFLLESACAWGDHFYRDSFDLILARYLDASVKDYRPPRFLLNDLIRYWRTMCGSDCVHWPRSDCLKWPHPSTGFMSYPV